MNPHEQAEDEPEYDEYDDDEYDDDDYPWIPDDQWAWGDEPCNGLYPWDQYDEPTCLN